MEITPEQFVKLTKKYPLAFAFILYDIVTDRVNPVDIVLAGDLLEVGEIKSEILDSLFNANPIHVNRMGKYLQDIILAEGLLC